jgi:hypothetical protein
MTELLARGPLPLTYGSLFIMDAEWEIYSFKPTEEDLISGFYLGQSFAKIFTKYYLADSDVSILFGSSAKEFQDYDRVVLVPVQIDSGIGRICDSFLPTTALFDLKLEPGIYKFTVAQKYLGQEEHAGKLRIDIWVEPANCGLAGGKVLK